MAIYWGQPSDGWGTMAMTLKKLMVAGAILCGHTGWAQLASGPLVGHTTDTSATIWAHAGQGKTVELRYGIAGSASGDLARVDMPPRSDRNFTSLAILPGLKPLTAYRYEVHVGGVKSGEGSFTTAPPAERPARFSYFIASCMDYKNAAYQVAWSHAAGQRGAFNLFVGDNVYADNTDHTVLWNNHREQRKIPGFAALIAAAPTYATWDDHDYGPNDSHGATPGKENSLRAFKDLWANPSFGSPQLPGVFFSYHWANVHFIVLDGRYHRTDEAAPLSPAKSQFGEAQLAWLYQQLKTSRSPFKVIVSGYDIMSAKFPEDLRKIAKFVFDNKIYGVVFHSGDIHRNDFKQQEHGMGYPVTRIVSSGITRVVNRPWVMMDVNTTLADPTISARFFTQEKLDSTKTLKLSSLTPVGTDDLILNSPRGGEAYRAGDRVAIGWTRVGTGVGQVDLEYSTGGPWMPIAMAAPNTGSFLWTAPDLASSTVKVRIIGASGRLQAESPGVFSISGATPIRLPDRSLRSKRSPPGAEPVPVFDLRGKLVKVLRGIPWHTLSK